MSDRVCALLVKYSEIFLVVVIILLLDVMKLLSVGGGALLVWSFKECVCCACDPSVHLDSHTICFVCVCRKLSPHLRV